MNEVLLNAVTNDATALASDQTGTISSHLDQACGDLIQRVIRGIKPKVGVEVGLAFGVSTLYILEAFKETGSQKLIDMDPAQHDDHWRGGGLRNVEAAGYAHLYEFHENTSQQVLPELVRRGVKIDFAFIDGWHTFDHTLIDFFYIDQLTRRPAQLLSSRNPGYATFTSLHSRRPTMTVGAGTISFISR